MGCNGGTIDAAFAHTAAKGLMRLSDYPYTGKEGSCAYDESKAEKVNTGFTVLHNNATATIEALQSTPVAALMQVNRSI